MKNIKEKSNLKYLENAIFEISNKIFTYRYDFFAIVFMYLVIIWFMSSLFFKGHIVFSDIDIPFDSKRYMEEIFGLWNGRWSSPSMLNMPRLFYASIPYGISAIFGFQGEVFLKSFLLLILFSSSTTMYLFGKRLVSIYISKEFNFFKIFALISGGLFYALNPWVVFRIQHIYLLCGYSMFPLVLMIFFNIFDPKFQKQLIPNYYIFNRTLYKKNIKDIIALAIVFSFLSGGIHYFFYSAIYLPILGFLILAKNLIVYRKYGFEKLKFFIINFLKKILWFVGFFMLFNFFWFGMYFGSILLGTSASQHNINVIDTLSMFSKHSSLKNVLYMISYWWPMFDLTKLPFTFYLGGGVIIFAITLSMLLRAYKYNIVLMFSFLSVVFIILATGVEIGGIAEIFIKVTKLPIIGSMFRDPNKLVGITALNFGVLLIFGLELFFGKFKNNIYSGTIETLIMGVFIVSLYFYIEPLKTNFIDGFYFPIEVPKEYSNVNEELKKQGSKKVIYMPIADNMTQSYTGVATPYWNVNGNEKGFLKATGDIQVYNSATNTVFHHEGNMQGISYYYNFIQYLLDSGRTRNLNSYIGRFGADSLVYVNQYLGKEEKQKFNLDILSLQKNMKLNYKNNIFNIFEQNRYYERFQILDKKLFTPYGYSHFESYNSDKSFNFENIGIIPVALERNNFLDYVSIGDFIEASNWNDLFFSTLPESYLIKPFDFINDGNVFLKWSKTFVKNSEWLWFLSSQDINNYPFDFDYFDGVAVTFASAKLDVLPYKMKSAEGRVIADFDSLLRAEKFFTPDNPELFEVYSNPIGEGNVFPNVHGELVKGDPKNIWQVAKSGFIEVKENNPYKFNIKVSGRGVNKVHFKARFFNNDMEELGINYVVAPSEEVNFDSINFFGEFVSPKESKFMRLDILSFQRPNQKAYWWVHDMNLYDLEKYKVKNIFTVDKEIKEDGEYDIYTRYFTSSKGGLVSFRTVDKEFTLNTFTPKLNKFIWKKLGTISLKKGKSFINVENIKGFNALNLIALVPKEKQEILEYPLKKALEKSKIFSIDEAENDFHYEGNLQSLRNYPDLSYGKGISLQNGFMEKEFEILKDGFYTFVIKGISDAKVTNGLKLNIYQENNRIFLEETKFNLENKINTKNTYISEYSEGTNHDRVLIKVKDINNNSFEKNFKNIRLKKGLYKMRLDFDSRVQSLSDFSDIHKFDPDEIVIDKTMNLFEGIDETTCVKIYPYMMRSYKEEDKLTIEYDKTCSKDWYVYASKKIQVEENNEYIVSFEAKSEYVKDRHIKVIFLDGGDKPVSVSYIGEVEEQYKNRWNKYEQIVKAPINAKKMLIQILSHGNREKNGYLYLKNYQVLPYKELILVDNVGIFQGNGEDFFKTENKDYGIENEKIDNMKSIFSIKNPPVDGKLLSFSESPSPMWNFVSDKKKEKNHVVLNSISSAYIIDGDSKGAIEINLRKVYYFGLFLVLISPLICYLVLRRYKE